ncbi:UNVERIFIED_ORG: prophage tail gpP-like protein [Rhizobium etli]
MLENLTISGLPPYKSISITSSAEEAVRTASIVLVPEGDGVSVAPGKAVTIKAGGDVLLTGYVRDVQPRHDAVDRSLTVTVCSRTVDATECSVDHPTGEILQKDLAAIAKEFDGLGIGIESDGSLPIEPRHKLRVGETLFATIERRARGRGILIYDTPQGRLKLATKPEGTHSGGLIWGVNIEQASSSITERGRYSSVKVRGQASEGTEKQQMRPEARARDAGVTRKRPLIIPHEGEVMIDRMKTRADWQVKRGAGYAATASIVTTGWRDGGGRIWTRNWLVLVRDAWIGIDGMMVIKSVTLEQDSANGGAGTTATLSLADPRALGGENPRGKTSDAYAAPGAITPEYEDQ